MGFLHFLKVTSHLPGIISYALCSLQLPRSLHSLNCVGLSFWKLPPALASAKPVLFWIFWCLLTLLSPICLCLPSPCVCVCVCVWRFLTLWTVALQAPLSMGFPRQEYWSGFAISSSRGSSWFAALQADSLLFEPQGNLPPPYYPLNVIAPQGILLLFLSILTNCPTRTTGVWPLSRAQLLKCQCLLCFHMSVFPQRVSDFSAGNPICKKKRIWRQST